MRRVSLPVMVSALLLAAACSGSDGGTGATNSAAPSTATTTLAPTTQLASSTTTLVTTTTNAPTTVPTTTPPDEAIEPVQFRRSYTTADELPRFPVTVEGFLASSDVFNSEVRLFDTEPTFETIYEFPGQGNRCEETFWVARWVAKSPTAKVQAVEEISWVFGADDFELEEFLMPPAAAAGMLGDNACHMPGFRLAEYLDGDPRFLVDVVVEWQYFVVDYFSDADTTSDTDAGSACSDYTYDDELPISVCSKGLSVELFQEALGLPVDGFFGPGTESTIREYQRQESLPVTGVMNAVTWSTIGVTSAAPFPDLNGDGVIDGSEFPG
jgi:peptidoglycan hydrolase-like protein with peptidoglycan-binding domain